MVHHQMLSGYLVHRPASSMVEQIPLKDKAVGSSPTRGTKERKAKNEKRKGKDKRAKSVKRKTEGYKAKNSKNLLK